MSGRKRSLEVEVLVGPLVILSLLEALVRSFGVLIHKRSCSVSVGGPCWSCGGEVTKVVEGLCCVCRAVVLGLKFRYAGF